MQNEPSMKEVFALAVYQGTEGLEGLIRIQSGEVDNIAPDAVQNQKCLMASFEDLNL